MDRFILNERNEPVLCEDLLTWGRWFEGANDRRRVALDETPKGKVSTVFLGLNHTFVPGPPVLFETMVFGGPLDGEQERYHTWDEAVAGHAAMLKRVAESSGVSVES